MPTIHPLTDQLSVAGQIQVDDVPALSRQGFRSIINNRPDAEAADQPSSAAIEAAAQQAGLSYRHLPVTPGQLPDALAKSFSEALHDLPAPVLAFCRTGNRSSMLWALQAEGEADAILDTAQAAGYDLSALRPRLGRA